MRVMIEMCWRRCRRIFSYLWYFDFRADVFGSHTLSQCFTLDGSLRPYLTAEFLIRYSRYHPLRRRDCVIRSAWL